MTSNSCHINFKEQPQSSLTTDQKKSLFPTRLTPKQLVEYYKVVYNIDTTEGTLAVKRCEKRGLAYQKIHNRIYYLKNHIDNEVDAARFVQTIDSKRGS